MKKCKIILLCGILLMSCSLRKDLMDLSERVSKLEQTCLRIENNIEALQKLTDAIKNNVYITNVTPILQGEKEIGYTISFSKGKPVTIYHGTAGHSPSIGVKLNEENGIYYWTIDGKWLTNEAGELIPAEGITPMLKTEGNKIVVSLDKGVSWTWLGEIEENILKSIEEQDCVVIFTLADGTVISVPKCGLLPPQQQYYIVSPACYYNYTITINDNNGTYKANAYVIGHDSSQNTDNLTYYVSASVHRVYNRNEVWLNVSTPKDMENSFDVKLDLFNEEDKIVESTLLHFEKLILTDNNKVSLIYTDRYETDVDIVFETNLTDINEIWPYCKSDDKTYWYYISRNPTKLGLAEQTITLHLMENTSPLPRFIRVCLHQNTSRETGFICKDYVIMQCGTEQNIDFTDDEVRRICLSTFDIDNDGAVSYYEAFCGKNLQESPFQGSQIKEFNELKYFGLLL